MNNEFVMVPREQLGELVDGDFRQQGSARNKLRALLAQPAAQSQSEPVPCDERAKFEKAVIDSAERFHPNLEQRGEQPDAEYIDPNIEWAWGLWQAQSAAQHQGEPVAWVIDSPEGRTADYYCGKGLDALQPGTKLYTHADTGEVEEAYASLLRSSRERNTKLRKERDNLRAQLAERGALLSRWVGSFGHLGGIATKLRDETKAALSASTEPSAIPFPGYPPVPEDRKLPAEPSAPKSCGACWQAAEGQGGEYPCKVCGLPTEHDPAPVERADIIADASYRNGVMHGYKLAMEGDEAEYQACINSLTGHLHTSRAALERRS